MNFFSVYSKLYFLNYQLQKENNMKIFGIMLVKNEVDIVGHTLKEAQKWCDKIFILDNGSTDGT